MAYAANADTRNRIPVIAGVALIHVGAFYALVSGLAVDVVKTITHNPDATNIEEQQPDVEVPLPPPPKAEDPVAQPPIAPQPRVRVDRNVDFTVIDPIELPKTSTVPLPNLPEPNIAPPAPPPPQFTPRGAAPRGNPGDWVTTSDYPGRALRNDQEGTTGFRLTVDARGRVTDCAITSSSGFADLDAATCKFTSKRARFEPATGPDGKPTTGSFSSRIVWRIPD